jgi:hypothetical protein
LVYLLDGLGIETGVQLDAVMAASRFIEARVGHLLPSRVYRAETGRRKRGAALDRQIAKSTSRRIVKS